ncbi:unnamed protein product [Arabidopsis lyrata]|uniref:stress-induced-phosphoprotein 1-like n=1 Tax=Arabidopsis lyrata subsp. lyrata TaxID=81972 RepID=UPI000A29E715|nr:stress-induced-phosphoprotein 1-like [Arabidopsis lyrata subsp. lyrata]CAH8272941.1 unnamed protein product [Arabidopsis lyrata]|eukprot:XP_020876079.1 stress-induced-phosphoprotein 1-like [Arabidopsis lyrata subsp. lyrata]
MAKELAEKAKKAYLEDDFDVAVDLYSKAIELDPNCAAFFADRAQAKIKTDNFTGAVADANRAIELEPTLAKAYLRMGTACMKLEEYRTAKAALEKGASVAPNEPKFKKMIDECDLRIAVPPSLPSSSTTPLATADKSKKRNRGSDSEDNADGSKKRNTRLEQEESKCEVFNVSDLINSVKQIDPTPPPKESNIYTLPPSEDYIEAFYSPTNVAIGELNRTCSLNDVRSFFTERHIYPVDVVPIGKHGSWNITFKSSEDMKAALELNGQYIKDPALLNPKKRESYRVFLGRVAGSLAPYMFTGFDGLDRTEIDGISELEKMLRVQFKKYKDVKIFIPVDVETRQFKDFGFMYVNEDGNNVMLSVKKSSSFTLERNKLV